MTKLWEQLPLALFALGTAVCLGQTAVPDLLPELKSNKDLEAKRTLATG